MNTETVESTSSITSRDESPEVALRAKLHRLRAAYRAQPDRPYASRLGDLQRLCDGLLRRKEQFVTAISEDFGHRSRHETLLAEVFTTVQSIRHTQAHLHAWMETRQRPVSWLFQPGKAELVPQPLGVVGIIAPWNYPMQLALAPLVCALAAGNRVMIKPSEFVPRTAALLQDMLADLFGDDHVAVVTGGSEVGEAFAALPFDHLLFTGSTKVGRLVMRAASANLTPVTLELGGKSPALVCPDASLERAAAAIVRGKLFNAGQTCIAPDYALVGEDRRDALVVALRRAVAASYPTLAANDDYSAVINAHHRARLKKLLDDATSRGATVVELNPAGERFEGDKMCPVAVLDVPDDAPLMQEEIFGPILPVRTYKSLDAAMDFINDRPRPLALYCFTDLDATERRVLAGTVSGGVCMNDTLLHFAQDDLPFGGVGESGLGRYHGREGFDAMSYVKPVFHQSRLHPTKLFGAPYGALIDNMLKLILR